VPGAGRSGGPDHPAGYVLRKLPHVTLLFWILKIIAVTLGETAGDLFGITLPGRLRRHRTDLSGVFPGRSSSPRSEPSDSTLPCSGRVVLGTSLVGTEISDLSNRGVGHGSAQNGIGYAWGAVILTGILVIVFLVCGAPGRPTTWRPSPAARRDPVLDCDLGLEHPGHLQRVTGSPTTPAWGSATPSSSSRDHGGDRGRALPDQHQTAPCCSGWRHPDPPTGSGRVDSLTKRPTRAA